MTIFLRAGAAAVLCVALIATAQDVPFDWAPIPSPLIDGALPTSVKPAPPSFQSPPEAKTLFSAEEMQGFSALFEKGFFDPRGARRAKVQVRLRGFGGDLEAPKVETNAWLVESPGKTIAILNDGTPVVPTKVIENIDFWKEVDDVFSRPAVEEHFPLQKLWEPRRTVFYGIWAWRLGKPELARPLLPKESKTGAWAEECGPLDLALYGSQDNVPKGELWWVREAEALMVWGHFNSAVKALLAASDEESLAHLELLEKNFSSGKAYKFCWQVPDLLKDLKRRARRGAARDVPAEFAAAKALQQPTERAKALVALLDELFAPQMSQPGWPEYYFDANLMMQTARRSLTEQERAAPPEQVLRRFAGENGFGPASELRAMGDVALPVLIQALEQDDRLTRTVHYWRDFSTGRTIISVRDVVLTIIQDVIKVRFFEPVGTGDDFTNYPAEKQKVVIAQVRKWYDDHHAETPVQRYRALLAGNNHQAWIDAARNLSKLGDRESTALICKRMLAENPLSRNEWCEVIGAMGDKAAVPDLRKAFTEGDRLLKVYPARAMYQLGDPSAAAEIARLFLEGGAETYGREAEELTWFLVECPTDAGDAALKKALENPDFIWHVKVF